FGVMALGVCGAVAGLDRRVFWLFLGSFLLLVVAAGAGNGSTYRMIPAIFAAKARGGDAGALLGAKREAAAAIGIASSIGAFGGFLIPRGFAMSLSGTGSIATAMYVFLGAYAVFGAANWWFYLRRRVLATALPSLAANRV
ncbi:MAG TPA: MFS transporter, partial [Phytomonospora sp.]